MIVVDVDGAPAGFIVDAASEILSVPEEQIRATPELAAGDASVIDRIATLDADGRINLSPKGYDVFRILDPNRVAWLDLGGSGNETQAHLAADGRIRGLIIETPLRPVELGGHRLWLKCECEQTGGAFKLRGATNRLLQLGAEERERGRGQVTEHEPGDAEQHARDHVGERDHLECA